MSDPIAPSATRTPAALSPESPVAPPAAAAPTPQPDTIEISQESGCCTTILTILDAVFLAPFRWLWSLLCCSSGREPMTFEEACQKGDRAQLLQNIDGKTQEELDNALFELFVHGHYALIPELLFHGGANVNARSGTQKTLLHKICEKGQETFDVSGKPLLEILLERGADKDAQDNHGNTPLHYACGNGAVTSAKLLVKKGANVHRTNDKHETALHRACVRGSVNLIELLRNSKARVDVSDKDGNRPLHAFASLYKSTPTGTEREYPEQTNPEMVLSILAKGENFDINAQNTAGDTALHLACISSDGDDTLDALLKNRAQVNIGNMEGYMPLHVASKNNNFPAVEKLVKRGADIHAADPQGRVPFKLCRQPTALMKNLLTQKD